MSKDKKPAPKKAAATKPAPKKAAAAPKKVAAVVQTNENLQEVKSTLSEDQIQQAVDRQVGRRDGAPVDGVIPTAEEPVQSIDQMKTNADEQGGLSEEQRGKSEDGSDVPGQEFSKPKTVSENSQENEDGDHPTQWDGVTEDNNLFGQALPETANFESSRVQDMNNGPGPDFRPQDKPLTNGGQTASVGRVVHYVPRAVSVEGEEGGAAAVVVGVGDGVVSLFVMGRYSTHHAHNVPYMEQAKDDSDGYWMWPPRV